MSFKRRKILIVLHAINYFINIVGILQRKCFLLYSESANLLSNLQENLNQFIGTKRKNNLTLEGIGKNFELAPLC